MRRLEARVLSQQTSERLENQACSDEENHRERDLNDNEHPERSLLLAARSTSAAATQCILRVDGGATPGGRRSTRDGDDERESQREAHHGTVDMQTDELLHARGGQRSDRVHTRDGEGDSTNDAECRQ